MTSDRENVWAANRVDYVGYLLNQRPQSLSWSSPGAQKLVQQDAVQQELSEIPNLASPSTAGLERVSVRSFGDARELIRSGVPHWSPRCRAIGILSSDRALLKLRPHAYAS